MWSVVELVIEVSWFYIVVRRPDDEDLGMLTVDPGYLYGIVSDATLSIKAIFMAVPPALNGGPTWQFEPVSAIWDGVREDADIKVGVVETNSKRRYVLAAEALSASQVSIKSCLYPASHV